ncbi:MAG: phage baseplate protein [Bacilli bacterium]
MNDIPVQLYDKDGNSAYPRPYYRIGDIIESTNPNNPGDDGYIGTWELYGQGRVAVCIDSNDSNFNTIGKEIGESTHTLTVDEMPKHKHNGIEYQNGVSVSLSSNGNTGYNIQWNLTGSSTVSDLQTDTTGGGQSHNNIQKSIVVYRWRRIA